MNDSAYDDCLQAMFSLRRFGIKLGLEPIQDILQNLGNPQKHFSSIHIAGSNGKGSIASALSTILLLAGYKVGLYTSPHLVRFNERICIDNQQIPDDHVVELCQIIRSMPREGRELTFFEYTTAMAFYQFYKQKVDWAVIETGMGGRLDATNIIRPELSIITNISLEHRMYLGSTLKEIAWEKAGIIKEKTPVVTAVSQPQVINVLREVAKEKSAPLYRLGDEFKIRKTKNGTFNYRGIQNSWNKLRTGLSGSYQIANAAVVLASCEILNQNGKAQLPFESIKKGLEQNRWPGRLEKILSSPDVYMDGAHNLDATRHLAKFFSQEMKNRPITFVLGILDDKPYGEMMRNLLPLCKKVILTAPKIDRALPPETLRIIADEFPLESFIIPKVGKAVRFAIDSASPEDVICIAGSLYVVGEAKQELEKSGLIPFQLKT